MEGSPGIRVSDQQRESAASQIREHFAAGRLTQDELDERVQSVYDARTEPELAGLLADLPALPASRRQQRAELAERRAHLQRRLIQEIGGAFTPFLICTVIWAASSAHRGTFWPIWLAIFPIVALVRNGWRLYGPAPELDRVERELERRTGRGARHRRHRRD